MSNEPQRLLGESDEYVICPYCYANHGTDEATKCKYCGKNFVIEKREVTIFKTSQDCDLNGRAHTFLLYAQNHELEACSVCGLCRKRN